MSYRLKKGVPSQTLGLCSPFRPTLPPLPQTARVTISVLGCLSSNGTTPSEGFRPLLPAAYSPFPDCSLKILRSVSSPYPLSGAPEMKGLTPDLLESIIVIQDYDGRRDASFSPLGFPGCVGARDFLTCLTVAEVTAKLVPTRRTWPRAEGRGHRLPWSSQVVCGKGLNIPVDLQLPPK